LRGSIHAEGDPALGTPLDPAAYDYSGAVLWNAHALRREDHTNQRGRAFHSFWLARTQLDQGKLDQACHTATQALEPASAVASERVSGHLREFYDQLTPHRQEPIALAFEARLRELLPPVSGSLHP
jgi:hypothetical protein